MNNFIFLPGLGFDVNIWQKNFANLNPKLIALPPLTKKTSLHTIITELNLQIPKGTMLIGWSLGGLLALALSYYFPEKIKKVLIIASTPKFLSDINWPGIPSALPAIRLKKKLLQYALFPLKNQAYKELLINHQLPLCENYLELLWATDLRSELAHLQTPVTFMNGERDCIIPIETFKALETINKKAKLITIKNAGHALPLSHSEEIMYEILT